MNREMFVNYIKKGRFDEAYDVMGDMNTKEIESILMRIGDEEQDLSVYTFVVSLLLKEEKVEYHLIAANIMEILFNYEEGAYKMACYHMKRATQLAPNDLELKKALLDYGKEPDRVLDDEEVSTLKQEIERIKPAMY